ncbi:MAG: RagB/SusD family nutrient uptake outer membrane protein, partial [Parabacteroides sp.]|nr:RagB/SusD family nutrient uptake outer membrane protein [Parabacteroides sp.]
KLSILQGSAEGSVVYEETHNSTSAKNGVVNLQIGNGNPTNGIFSNVDWSLSPYFIKLSMDTDGGNSFKDIATSQMLSVPYALYAERAGKTNQESKEDPTFIVTQTDNDNTSMFLTGAGGVLEHSSIGIYIAYLDGKDQEVSYDLKGLPLSDLKVIKEVSGPYGKFLEIEFSHVGNGEEYSGTFILKNKYGITKEYPFSIISQDTTSNQINPELPYDNIEDSFNNLTALYFSFREKSDKLDYDYMRIINTRSSSNSSIYDKTYTPSDYFISDYYNNAYQIINKANTLIEKAINTKSESNIYQEFINNSIVIRAYTYLMLTTWFGDIPLITNVPTVEETLSIHRTPRLEVLQFIIDNLRKLHGEGTNLAITADPMFFYKILYKSYLLKKDYNMVIDLINRNENTHPLFTFIKKIANWKLSKLEEVPENISEAILMEEYINNLYQEDKDGNLFLNVLEYSAIYFNMDSNKALLPIPQSEIDTNPNMTQNPGY